MPHNSRKNSALSTSFSRKAAALSRCSRQRHTQFTAFWHATRDNAPRVQTIPGSFQLNCAGFYRKTFFLLSGCPLTLAFIFGYGGRLADCQHRWHCRQSTANFVDECQHRWHCRQSTVYAPTMFADGHLYKKHTWILVYKKHTDSLCAYVYKKYTARLVFKNYTACGSAHKVKAKH